MNGVMERLGEVFSPERIAEYVLGKLLPDAIVALLTFLAFWLLWRVIRRTAGLVLKDALDATAQGFILTVLRYAVLGLGAVTALAQIGIDTGSIITSLGVAGLTIGFAARDALSNIISGLFIFWDRPFVIGDLVEVGSRYGRVEEITMRSTRVVTVDGKMLAIPNSEVVNSTVVSYTNFPNLRLDVPVSIGLEEDVAAVRETLLKLVRNDERFLDTPPPTVVVTTLGDYSNTVELRAWLANEREHMSVRFELREKIYAALQTAGVEMPSETIAVRLLKDGDASPPAELSRIG